MPRDIRLALILCLVSLLGGFLAHRSAKDPWDGRLGRAIYQEGKPSSSVGKYAQAFRFFSDSEAPGREKMRVADWIDFGFWMGTLGFTAAALVFTLSIPLWVRACRGGGLETELPEGWRASRASWLFLLVSILLATAIRVPVLNGSILWDEQDNHRRNYHGYLDWAEPGQPPKFVEAGWKDSIWENRRGNNPHLYSFLSWTSNTVWRAATGAPRSRSSVVATRAPAAILGILSIVSLWWMLNAVGLPRLAPVAALLSAAHPLSTEFGIQARAYCITLLLTPILMAAAWRMLARGRKRDFALFSGAMVPSLLAFPGALYGIAAVNFAVLGAMLWQWRKGDASALARVSRWTVMNVISGVVFLCVLAPGIPQMAAFLNNAFQSGVMPPFWYIISYNLFATGMHFGFPREPFFNPTGPWPSAWAWLFGEFWRAWPVALWSLVVMPALFAIGWFGLFRTARRLVFLVIAAMILGGIGCVAHHALVTGYYIYAWYAIYALPAILIVIAAGLHQIACWFAPGAEKQPRQPAITGGLAIAAAMVMLALSHPMVRPDGWTIGEAKIYPRPVAAGWAKPGPNLIPRSHFQRNRSLWVFYADGYHILFEDYDGKMEAWKPHIDRPLEQWGQEPK
jgi:hypothetical protein